MQPGPTARVAPRAVSDTRELRDSRLGTYMRGTEGLHTPGTEAKLKLTHGKTIPGTRYRIIRWLGEGGMGVVYSAFDPQLNRKVAIKLLRSSGRRTLNAEPRLLREAKALALLCHPNVVTVFDVGTVGGRVFLAMEHVPGVTLGRWQRKRGRTWSEIVDAYVQAGRGLAAAHREKLTHRDFKPDNALVDELGRVRVLDFGLAVQDASEQLETSDSLTVTTNARLTMSGMVMGTPAYMSPQQLRGESPDARADQFSFCVALFEALYGERPFRGGSIEQLTSETLFGEIRQPRDRRSVPARVHAAIVRGLSPRAEDRWPTMDALLARLDRGQRRFRRSVGLAAAGLLCTSVAVAGMHAQAAAKREPCQHTSDKVTATWNDGVRSAMAERAEASQLSYATETWTRVDAGLDAYADQWARARRETCLAAEQPADVLDLRMQCLDARMETFAALVDVLQDPDASVVRHAARAVGSLPSLARCSDVEALRSNAADPPPPNQADEVASIRTGLASARALELAGIYQPGLDAALALVERARQTEHVPVIAEALLRAGNLYGYLGDYAAAEAAQSEAAMLAVEAGDADAAARAMAQLTGIVGYYLARPDDGLDWARHARAMIVRARLGREAQAQLTNNTAAIHFRAGQYELALERYEQAASTLSEATTARERQELASAHNNRGNSLAQLGRLDEAQVHLERGLALVTDLRGSHHPDLAVIMGNLANIYLHTGRPDDAVDLHTRALEIRKATLPLLHPHLSAAHGNLGLSHAGRGDFEQAHRHLLRAVELKEAAVGGDHPDLALTLNNLGEIERSLGHYDEAIASHTRAQEIWIAAHGEEHPYSGYPAANLGWDHLEAGHWERARGYLERALTVCDPQTADTSLLALSRLGLARVLVHDGEQLPRAKEMAEYAAGELVGTRYPRQGAQAVALVQALEARGL